MKDTSNKFARFWNELKRRKVLRSLAIYAGTAFIILEAATIIFPRWGFPDWSIDLVLWLLILGAFINVIIAWIYDITPGGIQRTRPLEEQSREEKAPDSRGWKAATYISLVVIVALVIFNVFSPSRSLKAGDIQSLVILPFENFTGDDQLENMVAGMHSMLIGDMGRVSGLRVIGKTSSKLYKDADMSAGEIAGELNVDAVVEATIMSLGDTVWMQFILVSTNGEEEQLWVGEYRVDKGQILNLYNRVTKQITEEILITLTDSEENFLASDREADRDAIDAYIRSYAYWGDLSTESLDKAEEYLSLALEKDPEWAPIHAAMAIVWVGRLQMGMVESETGRQKVYEYIRRAHELDAEFADSPFINAVISIWTDWDWERGERELLQALATNPNHVMSRMYYAHLLMSLQRMDEAMVQGKLALELDPMNPLVLALYSVVLKGAGQHQAVMETLEKALAIDPGHDFTNGQMGRAYYNLGEYEKNLELQENYLTQQLGEERVPDLDSIYRKQGRLAAYQELARIEDFYAEELNHSPISRAIDLYRAGNFTRAIDELEKAYEMHEPNLPYIGTGTRFEALHDSARFLDILDKMNLPHPKTD
jgi:adenylate cyclase